MKKRTLGFLFVLLGAILWGVGGTVAQRLFQEDGMTVGWLVAFRLIVSGILLLVLTFLFKRNESVFQIWKQKQTVLQLLIFSLFGMLAIQYTYMASIQLGNAAVATLLQYLAPVFIIVFLVLTKVNKWKSRDVIAVSLALTGTFLLLTNGSLSQLSVPFSAVVWGVLSGVALAFYTLYGKHLLAQWEAVIVVGWAMLIGGTSLGIFYPPWNISVNWTTETVLYLLFVVLFGTMLAFWLYLESLHYLKPQESSLLGSVEPLAAIVTSVLWLQIPFGIFQVFGTCLIFIMIIYLSISTEKPEPSENPNLNVLK